MSESAGARFWRGVREPWELIGRMRQDQSLWSRYWRTVVVQAVLTGVVGLAIFWVGKQGAEAWKDAFGPQEPESSAPVSAAGSGPAAEGAPTPTPSGAAPGKATPRSSPPTAEPPAPAPPAAPATKRRSSVPAPPALKQTLAPGSPEPSSGATTPPPSGPTASTPSSPEPDSADEEDAEDGDSAENDLEATLEAKIKALQKASPEERGKRTGELVAAAVEKAKKQAGRAERRAGKGPGKVEDEAEDLKDEREALSDQLEDLAIASDALAQETPKNSGEARRARRGLERRLDHLEKEAATLQRKGAAPLSAAERARLERARSALQVARRHERGLAGRLGAVLALLAAIYASLGIAQTCVLALSRDFHDALSRDLSLLVQVAPEDPPMRPKIRLDLPWVRRKANRRAQFFLGFLPGAALISVVGWLVPPHRTLTTVLTTLWGAYWWVVMTAGRSTRAWTPPESTPRPWYLRAWFTLTERVFLFRWGLPRWWGRIGNGWPGGSTVPPSGWRSSHSSSRGSR